MFLREKKKYTKGISKAYSTIFNPFLQSNHKITWVFLILLLCICKIDIDILIPFILFSMHIQ